MTKRIKWVDRLNLDDERRLWYQGWAQYEKLLDIQNLYFYSYWNKPKLLFESKGVAFSSIYLSHSSLDGTRYISYEIIVDGKCLICFQLFRNDYNAKTIKQ